MGVQYVGGYEFVVYIMDFKVSFKKISNIESKIELETIPEGGAQYPTFRAKRMDKPDTLILEKGVHSGFTDVLFSKLEPGMKLGTVIIAVKYLGDVERILYFDEGMITSKKFTDLDATKSEIWIESLTIAHSGLKESRLGAILL